MNQILVTEKLYVTPELKRKKKIYQFNFILSIIVIVVLCSVYFHSEYAQNKDQEISEDILTELIESQEELTTSEQQIANEDDGIWKIMISSAQQSQNTQQQNQISTQQTQTTEQQEENNSVNNSTTSNNSNTATNSSNNTKVSSTKTTTTKKKRVTYITASNGKRYPSIGRIRIPKINVDCAILDEAPDEDVIVEWLRVSPVKFWGVDPNEIGNFSIAGHNYRNNRFFSKVPKLTKGDKIKITDSQGKTYTYAVYDKYEVSPKNTECITDRPGKENKRVVTLITCTNDTKKRVIVHAEQI